MHQVILLSLALFGADFKEDSVFYDAAANSFLPLSGGTLTGQLIVPAGTAAAPGLSISDGNDGLTELSDGLICMSVGGTSRFCWTGTRYYGDASTDGGQIRAVTSSATVPTLNPAADSTAYGVGGVPGSTVDLIVNSVGKLAVAAAGVTIFQLDPTPIDVGATCTAGFGPVLDTGGAVDEICYCTATDTWACSTIDLTGPAD